MGKKTANLDKLCDLMLKENAREELMLLGIKGHAKRNTAFLIGILLEERKKSEELWKKYASLVMRANNRK